MMVRLDKIPRNAMGEPLRAMLGFQYGSPQNATYLIHAQRASGELR
jgi:hypothetical protein